MTARELLRLDALPVYQNKMFDTESAARACPRGDMVLVQNDQTGLVSNSAFAPGMLAYDQTYQNEQGHSGAFQEHLNEVMKIIRHHFGVRSILEIGCGKGAFLDQLRLQGLDARGVDPAYEGDAPYIFKATFSASLGLHSEAIVMRHVLEHIPDPLGFLQQAKEANGGNGLIYIEVPCLDWILRKRAWFDIFYEHVNYFRATDFARIFADVRETGRLFGGQYLYVVAELASLRDAETISVAEKVEMPGDFFASIERCMQQSTHATRRIVWGGAAKGVMFSHHVLARGLKLDCVIDINPAKQGKFLAASALPVFSPRSGLARIEPGADIFVMNSNYLSEIQALAGPAFNYITVDRS